jgi:hypothetical protein
MIYTVKFTLSIFLQYSFMPLLAALAEGVRRSVLFPEFKLLLTGFFVSLLHTAIM